MGVRRDGVNFFGGKKSVQHVSMNGQASILELCHKRTGHPSEKVVKLLPPVTCEVCFHAKRPRDKISISVSKTTIIFEKAHRDLWGPYKHPSSCGARYFLTLVDDYSRAVWIYLFIDKTNVFQMFLSFIAMTNRQLSQKIPCLHDYCSITGILFQICCVGTLQQNGRVKRKQKNISRTSTTAITLRISGQNWRDISRDERRP
ncbi:hypothetical protein OSB04_028168 [Centaurea solstitialis]|uniref:Integrase catalytic domain-containing protein n=1 Tax=Centaurea solstitialis TaxID=347529 RepID=A0AA38SYR4_9ASTR|nr:hypothetical protein OSB04_028168 [Centaurea solstitialis]